MSQRQCPNARLPYVVICHSDPPKYRYGLTTKPVQPHIFTHQWKQTPCTISNNKGYILLSCLQQTRLTFYCEKLLVKIKNSYGYGDVALLWAPSLETQFSFDVYVSNKTFNRVTHDVSETKWHYLIPSRSAACTSVTEGRPRFSRHLLK